MIKAVILDMDGTMFDTEALALEAWERASQELCCKSAKGMIAKSMGLRPVQMKKLFLDTLGEDFPYDAFIQFGKDYSADYIEKHGIPIKPGLYELLNYLKDNGYKIGVATSTAYDSAMKHFERAEVTRYFDKIICGDMLEKSKPAPDIYLKAAEALEVAPPDCLALEDSPNGVTSAYRAGMKTVMIPDLIIPDQELRKMLFACVPSLNEVITLLKEQKG
jgi:HAD superfamily hydrolase (TIGR01509 family)